MAVCGELASEETTDQSHHKLQNEWMNIATLFWIAYTGCPRRKYQCCGRS